MFNLSYLFQLFVDGLSCPPTRVATPRAPKSKESKSVKIVSRKQNVNNQNQSGSEGKYKMQNFILLHKLL